MLFIIMTGHEIASEDFQLYKNVLQKHYSFKFITVNLQLQEISELDCPVKELRALF